MAYASWSVVFGEQPSAAKWNILGTNDAAFNNGTGIPTASAATASETSSTGTTTSTSYTATLTSGGTNPVVTLTVGATGIVSVYIYSYSNDNGANVATFTSFALSSANTLAADDSRSIKYSIPTGGGSGGYGAAFLLTGLTPGSTVFTMQYRVVSGTGSYSNRRIAVIPY